MLDVGAGTGLLADAARRRLGPNGHVVALDQSAAALDICAQATSGGDTAPLSCVVGDAGVLPFGDDRFDSVLCRSVLIYLADKALAIAQMHRVVGPGGRVSVFEPINEAGQRIRRQRIAQGFYSDLEPEFSQVQRNYEQHADEWWGTLVGWDEGDLYRWFVAAGFCELEMTYVRRRGVPGPLRRSRAAIAAGLRARPNPNMPSYEEVANQVLGEDGPAYLARYVDFVRQRGVGWSGAGAVAYVTATK